MASSARESVAAKGVTAPAMVARYREIYEAVLHEKTVK
jgi:hypothetical protein